MTVEVSRQKTGPPGSDYRRRFSRKNLSGSVSRVELNKARRLYLSQVCGPISHESAEWADSNENPGDLALRL